jgi:putative phosphoribosyl transferase
MRRDAVKADALHEMKELHDRVAVFRDREEAGGVLSDMLEPVYGGREDVTVLAVPAGGVPVGLKVRERLGAPFDLVVARKLKIPHNREAGFGAMTHGGKVFLNEALIRDLRLEEEDIEAETEAVEVELEKRNHLFREGRPFPPLQGRVAVLVDDGLASGYTMLSSIYMVKDRGAARTVVAVPTAPKRTLERIQREVDEIYCPNVREGTFFAVADAYVRWYDLGEEEVVELLKKAVG